MSVSMLLLLAVIGMAFDLGRIYIARNEAQVFTDAAAMTAATQLDGTAGAWSARGGCGAPAHALEPGYPALQGVVVEFSADGMRLGRRS